MMSSRSLHSIASMWPVVLLTIAMPFAGATCSCDSSIEDSGSDEGAGGSGIGAAAGGTGGSEGDGGTGGSGGSRPLGFVHPGLLNTEADFERMKAKVAANEQPWVDGWNALINSSQASLEWMPNPQETVIRGGDGQNFQIMVDDIHAAYATALRWKVSGDTAYADKSVEILNAWSSTLTSIQGNSDRFLAAGIYGFQFANAAEIMRTYPGWAAADFERFKDMMLNIFYPMNHDFLVGHNGSCISHFWANWDLAQMATMLSIGVLTDREDIYKEAVDYLKTGQGNGALAQAVYHVHPGYLGQWNESARDQGHSTLGIGLLAVYMEMAWNQGDDLYGYDNNRFLAGAEYVAKYNLFNEVPYVQYGPSCSPDGHLAPEIAVAGQGHMRAIWESVYNHYVNRKGLAAPYSAQMAAQLRPEGMSTSGDQIGFGTLTFSRDPIASGATPSGLTATAIASGEQVMLSWWGSAHATSYNVKRATASGGPYTTVGTTGADAETTFTDTTVEDGATYYYVISAMSPSGESEDSAEAAATGGISVHAELNFDADSGTTAADESGHGRDGTLVNGPTWTAGNDGNAIMLDGVDDYVSLPERVVSDLSEITIATWVYLESASTWSRIFDFGLGPMRYMTLTPQTNEGTVRFAITVIGASGEQKIEGPQALPTGQWVHVAVTLSGNVGTLYIDGVEVGRNEAIVLTPYQLGSSAMPQNWIGRSQYPSDPYLNGMIDDFRIYNGALTAGEIADLAEAD